MKYFKRIIWLVLAIFLLASVIIGIGIIFAVKNVNVSLESFRYADWDYMTDEERSAAESEINLLKGKVLDKFRGTLITYIKEEKVAECFEGTDFVLDGFETDYPCTLNLSLRERRETFAVASGSGYAVYDENGEYLCSKDNAFNSIDGAPDVAVSGASADEMADVAFVAKLFGKNFSALRPVVSEIEVQKNVTSNMVFYLYCGLKVRIVDYPNLAEGKASAAFKEYASLTGEQKLSGTIIASVRADGGAAVAERTPD